MADDLERRLEALGQSDPPPVSDARLEAIGARVMEATSAPVDRGRRTLVLAVAAALIALLVAGIVMASVREGDETRLDLAAGVTLELPDGVTADGEAGDELPDGTVVSVAPGGSAFVDGQRFGPGRYRVIGGEMVRIATPSTTSTTDAPADPVPDGEPSGTSAPVVPAADADPPTRTTTTIARTTPTTGTRPADRPIDRPPTDPDRSTTTRPVERPPTTTRGPTPTTVRDRPTTTMPADRSPPSTRPDTTTTTTTATTTTTTSTTVPSGDGERDRRRP